MSLAGRVINRASRAARTLVESSTTNSAVILMYHRVGSPSNNILTVTPDAFREQMRVLREEYEPVPLSALDDRTSFARAAANGKKRVAVTFDDGYADTLFAALPAMREFSVPGTVFVTTGTLGMRGEFWWDELEELLTRLGRSSECQALAVELKLAGRPAIDAKLTELRALAGGAPEPRDDHRTLTVEELKTLAADPLIEIGAHTVTHPCLGRIPRDEQRREILDSKLYLERALDRPVTSLAYPFGDSSAFNGDSLELASELGFRMAVSTLDGVVSPHSKKYALPRFLVRDWGASQFHEKLQRYFWVS